MPASNSTPGYARRAALRCESALQAVTRRAARTWGDWRHGNAETAAGTGRCHCPAGLPEHLVHSEALREACDLVVDFGTNVQAEGRPARPVAALRPAAARLRPGATIHVKTDLLEAFVAELLPQLRHPFVLVTGDSDAAPMQAHRSLLEHPRLIHWFAQNCDLEGRHPRLTRIPIGCDNPVYTKLEKRLGFLITMAMRRTPFDPSLARNDIGDQRLLQDVARGLPPNRSRPPRALCTFHQNQKIVAADVSALPERAAAVRTLSAQPACTFVRRRLPQRECWEAHRDYAFEVSPRGNGLDCFRTWEALVLGCIPIVRRSTLDPLYEDEGLPVVVVREWDEIDEPALRRWQDERAGRFDAAMREKLTAGYWLAKIQARARTAGAL